MMASATRIWVTVFSSLVRPRAGGLPGRETPVPAGLESAVVALLVAEPVAGPERHAQRPGAVLVAACLVVVGCPFLRRGLAGGGLLGLLVCLAAAAEVALGAGADVGQRVRDRLAAFLARP